MNDKEREKKKKREGLKLLHNDHFKQSGPGSGSQYFTSCECRKKSMLNHASRGCSDLSFKKIFS